MPETTAGTASWTDAAGEDQRLAGEVLDLFFATLDLLRGHLEHRIVEFDLSPMATFALRTLHEPMAMGKLAETLGCDPSHVTGVADELEARGALERRTHPSDRRVKLLAITDVGERLRMDVERRLLEDVPIVKGLTHDELVRLRDLLATIRRANEGHGPAPDAEPA